MSKKTIALLSLLLILVSLGWWLNQNEVKDEPVASEFGVLFPDLESQLPSLTGVQFQNKSGSWSLAQADNVWGVVERRHYPANVTQLRSLVQALAKLSIVEPKTKKPERFSELQLQDIDASASQSFGINLLGPQDQSLASLLLGKRAADGISDRYYVRKVGEAQTWLVEGGLDIPRTLIQWLDQSLLTIETGRLTQIEVQMPDEVAYFLDRDPEDDEAWLVRDLPVEQLVSQFDLNQVANTLVSLSLEEVAPDKPGAQSGLLRTTIDDGSIIEVVRWQGRGEEEGGYENAQAWLTLDVSIGADADDAGKAEWEHRQSLWYQRYFLVSDHVASQLFKSRAEFIQTPTADDKLAEPDNSNSMDTQ